DRRGSVGDPPQRYLACVRQAQVGAHRGEGDQPPGRRSDEGVPGGVSGTMEFLIADTFTDSLARLTGDEQKAVKTTDFDLQINPAQPGMNFHKLANAKDKGFWSVRVSQDIRLIVHRAATSFFL